MRIQVLSDQVINKIAAGEVVDRPVSIVRELVDNAVDAGASEISVEIQNGGKKLIKVSDNGHGMSRDDALLAFERHATSKIKDSQDLNSISTYGFRGEALPSIAAVSNVNLISRTEESNIATALNIKAGKIRSVEPLAGPVGSVFSVTNLFFNTPARRKFLKQSATENRRISQWLGRYSLANPEIRFTLILDEKRILSLPGGQSFVQRASRLIKGSASEVSYKDGQISVNGLVAHPALAQYDSDTLTIIVNGRVVSDRILLRAVRDGFDATLKEREFPTGCINLTLPADQVDVNVHPQKSEVRFLDHRTVFNAVKEAVMLATKKFSTPVSKIYDNRPEAVSTAPVLNHQSSAASYSFDFNSVRKQVVDHEPFLASSTPELSVVRARVDADQLSQSFKFIDLRYIGQVLDCYLICQHEDMLVSVDMHAAHERINFNRLRSEFYSKQISSQQLLIPIAVKLSENLAEGIKKENELLGQLGFEIDSLSAEDVVVRSVPAILLKCDINDLIKQIAEQVSCFSGSNRAKQAIDDVILRIACHASIRSGYQIKREEVYALFAQMDQAEFSAACPHGRPVVATFSRTDVEKWFGRDR